MYFTFCMHICKTNSMNRSPSREAKSPSVDQQIPYRLWNPKVRYHVHKSPLLTFILNYLNSVHTFTSYILRSISILSSHLRLWVFQLKLFMHFSSPWCLSWPAHLIWKTFVENVIVGSWAILHRMWKVPLPI
jgi:hypothetical protein